MLHGSSARYGAIERAVDDDTHARVEGDVEGWRQLFGQRPVKFRNSLLDMVVLVDLREDTMIFTTPGAGAREFRNLKIVRDGTGGFQVSAERRVAEGGCKQITDVLTLEAQSSASSFSPNSNFRIERRKKSCLCNFIFGSTKVTSCNTLRHQPTASPSTGTFTNQHSRQPSGEPQYLRV